MKRIRVVAGRTVLVTAVTAVVLSGCSALSPATISTPYPPADGVGLTLPGTSVLLRDFLVIGTAKDAPAAVLGTVVNDGDSAVEVSLQAPLGTATATAAAGATPATAGQAAQTLVNVAAHGTVRIGPDQTAKMVISDLAVPPGATTTLTAATQAGGRANVELPVMLPQGIYASLTPAPTPSATPTATALATSAAKAGKKKKKKSATSTTATDSATATAAPTATAVTN